MSEVLNEVLNEAYRWFNSLPREHEYRILETVRVGKERELAFCYDSARDRFAMIEIAATDAGRSLFWIPIGRDESDLQEALAGFAVGEVGPDDALIRQAAPDDQRFTVYREIAIGDVSYLGFAWADDLGIYALAHRTPARTHVIPIEEEYDDDAICSNRPHRERQQFELTA